MRPSQKVETFPDGVVAIRSEEDRRLGPVKATLRFEEQSVGVNRFYSAQESVAGSRIDRVIKVPHTPIPDRLDIAIIGGVQYRINRIQYKPERRVDLFELASVPVAIKEGTT